MTPTPDNVMGKETEEIMWAIVEGHEKQYSTEKYNKCYEAIYALLCEIETSERLRITYARTQ